VLLFNRAKYIGILLRGFFDPNELPPKLRCRKSIT